MELVLIMVIVGIIAITAIPRYIDFTADAENASDDGTIAGVKELVSILYLKSIADGTPTYPTMADLTNNMEQPVLYTGITPDEWSCVEAWGGNLVVLYCPHGTTAAGRRIWVYFRQNLGSWTAGSVVEFGAGPHT